MASGSAIILPMVKDTFLIGFVVVEGVTIGPKTGKLKPVKPVWPPRKATRSPAATISLSKQQLTELPKIARTLALACVVDQVNLNNLLVCEQSHYLETRACDLMNRTTVPPLTITRHVHDLSAGNSFTTVESAKKRSNRGTFGAGNTPKDVLIFIFRLPRCLFSFYFEIKSIGFCV